MADGDYIRVGGKKYILAEVAEKWKRERDMLKKSNTRIHAEVHTARRALIASEKGEKESPKPRSRN